jgi:GT2 family glycosyltransferase
MTASAQPWLSVIMPTYNGGATLGEALESIARQADPRVEVIAVDDGSSDGTLKLLDSYAGRLGLRLEARSHIGNWVANTNRGLQLARGEFVCFLHQDDAWLPGRLEALRTAIRDGGAVRLWLHACWFVGPNGRRLGKWTCPLPDRRDGFEPTEVLGRLLVQNWVGIPTPLFRRADALAVGGLDESLWFTADWDLWLKLAALGPTRYLPRPLAAFRIHAVSQTAKGGPNELLHQYRAVQERHFPRWPVAPSLRRLVRAVADLATDVNGALAARFHGGRVCWGGLLARLARLGPEGWLRFWRDSRLAERVAARLRAKLRAD